MAYTPTGGGGVASSGVVVCSTVNNSWLFGNNDIIYGMFNGSARAGIALATGSGNDVGLVPGGSGNYVRLNGNGAKVTWDTTAGTIGEAAPAGNNKNPTDIYAGNGFHWLGATRAQAAFTATSNVTLAPVTNLTPTVVAGASYFFVADIKTTSNSAAGVQIAIGAAGGGNATATAIDYDCQIADAGANVVPTTGAQRSSAIGTAVGVTAVSNAQVRCQGSIVVNAGGTFPVQFAQNVSNAAASTVLADSTWIVSPF
jgi:hypothetical protein